MKSDSLNTILDDLKESLKFSDNPRVLQSLIVFFNEQCSPEELKIIENKILAMNYKEYENYSEFIEDYQPIFDLVEFSMLDCLQFFDKKKFTEEKLDNYINKSNL